MRIILVGYGIKYTMCIVVVVAGIRWDAVCALHGLHGTFALRDDVPGSLRLNKHMSFLGDYMLTRSELRLESIRGSRGGC